MNDKGGIILASFLWAIGCVFIGLRVYYRVLVTKCRLDASDYLLVSAALLDFITRVGTSVLLAEKYSAQTRADLRAYAVRDLKFQYALPFWYITGLYLLKASFLASYWKLLPGLSKRFKITLIALIAYCLTAGACIPILIHAFYCLPISRNWSLEDFCSTIESSEHMLNFTLHTLVSDVLIMLYGIWVIAHQGVTSREKFGIAFLIFLGICSMVAALVRYEKLHRGDFSDAWLCELELTAATVACCLPTFRAWFRKALGSWSTATTDEQKQENDSRETGDFWAEYEEEEGEDAGTRRDATPHAAGDGQPQSTSITRS